MIKEKKRAHMEQRKMQRRMDHVARKHQRKCFWTRPFGHKYEALEAIEQGQLRAYECVGCGKRRFR